MFNLILIVMRKNYQWFKMLSVKLMILLFGLSCAYGQNYEKMYLVGEHLSNFSITEMCCGGEGYVVAGTKKEKGNHPKDILITAMDDQGNPVWNKIVDNDLHERVFHIEAVSEGYALTGFIRGPQPSFNRLFFILLDPSGNVLINHIFHDPNQPSWQLQGAHVLEVQNGGGYLVTGYYKEYGIALTSPKSVQVLRLDATGNLIWGRLYDSPDDGRADFDMGAFAMELEEGFYITGSANVDKGGGLTTQGVLSLLIDFSGNIVWDNNFALDAGTDFERDADLGTSAIYDENERLIVVSANTTESTNFYLTKVDPATGTVVNQRHFDVSDDFTPSYYLGQNVDDQYVVSGMIKSTPVRYDCSGNPTVYASVPYIVEITPDLNTVTANVKYPMYAPSFSTDDGSVFHSHFGGPANLERPLITTPEMAFTHRDQNRTVLLGYREDGPAGKYDLQFISNQSPAYEWCEMEGMDIEILSTKPLYGRQMNDTPFDELEMQEGNPAMEVEAPTLECSTSLPSGSGQFPIVQTSTAGSEVKGPRLHASDRNLVVKNGYTYAIGQFTGSMNNPSLSSTATDHRPWVAKYDPNGNLLWGRKADGTTGYNSSITGIDVDANNNVYVSGYFTTGTLLFDGDPNPPMTSGVTLGNGGWSSYVIKYDANGSFQWRALMIKDTNVFGSAALISDLVVGDDGNIYVTGTTVRDVKFYTGNYVPDPIMGGASSLTTTPAHVFHAFIAKYDPGNGQLVFFESENTALTGDMSNFFSRAIQVDPSGSIYLGGDKFDGTLIISYPFVLKANASGIVTGTTANAATAEALLLTMTLDGDYLYVGGSVVSSLNFAGCTVSGLDHDGWFARVHKNTLACSGLNTVVDGTSGYQSALVTDIEVHSNGDAYVLGYSSGDTTSFSNGGSVSLIGNQDLFLAKYNTALTSSAWQQNFGGSGTSAYTGTIVEDDVNCGSFITGFFTGGTVDLGVSSGIISAPTGTYDHFVARIDELGASYKTAGDPSGGVRDEEGRQRELLAGEDAFAIYPNPASTWFLLEGLRKGDQVDLLNGSGSLISSFEAEGEELKLERRALASGLYMIKVTRGEETIMKKLMLQ